MPRRRGASSASMARLSSHPCVVHDLRHYSAALRQKWTHEYLCDTHSSTPVEVSLSQTGMLEGAVDEHETLTMGFGEQFMAQSDASWRRKPSRVHLHLAQCPLAQLPALQADVSPPDVVLAAAGRSQPTAHLWLCIGAGRSSLHYDGSDGLLLIVRGCKKLTLLPPSATRLLRPRAAHLHSANHTTLDASELDALLRSPSAASELALVRLEARAGDAVFIPSGWWHVVDSEGEEGQDVTMAVNWWWDSAASGATDAPTSAAAFRVRSDFAALVRLEEERLLRETAGLPLALSNDASSAIAMSVCGCSDTSSTTELELTRVLVLAAAQKAGDDTPQMLSLAIELPAHQVIGSLSRAAATHPTHLAELLGSRLGAAGAHILGRRLQESQAAACARCAARAAEQIESTFRCIGPTSSVAQQEARGRLLRLERDFSDAAAASVLRDTLGIDPRSLVHAGDEYAPTKASAATTAADTGGIKRRREELPSRSYCVAFGLSGTTCRYGIKIVR